jgi:hypothetical protein
MKKEMEKSFKTLSEGRAAGIKEVQKEVLGVTDQESDSLMDGLVNEEVAPAEEEPETVAEPTIADEIKEKILKKTKEIKAKKVVQPVEP